MSWVKMKFKKSGPRNRRWRRKSGSPARTRYYTRSSLDRTSRRRGKGWINNYW